MREQQGIVPTFGRQQSKSSLGSGPCGPYMRLKPKTKIESVELCLVYQPLQCHSAIHLTVLVEGRLL